jgi:hypothetical protein
LSVKVFMPEFLILNSKNQSFEILSERSSDHKTSPVLIKGFASTSVVDRNNEVVRSPLEFDLKTFSNSPQLLLNHKYILTEDGNEVAAGSIKKTIPSYIKMEDPSDSKFWLVFSLLDDSFVSKWEKNKSPLLSEGDKGLFILAEVTNEFAKDLVLRGEVGSFSWRGFVIKSQAEDIEAVELRLIDLIEISIVHIQSERGSTFVMADLNDPIVTKEVDLDDCCLYQLRFNKKDYSIEDIVGVTKSLGLSKSDVSEDLNNFYIKSGGQVKKGSPEFSFKIGNWDIIAAQKKEEISVPYKIYMSDSCPNEKPWAVSNSDGSKIYGCHETQEKARDQMSALYSVESKSQEIWHEGMMVRATYKDKTVVGKIEHVMLDGSLGTGSNYEIKATPENPALLLRVYLKVEGYWQETEYFVGVSAADSEKMNDLNETETIESNKLSEEIMSEDVKNPADSVAAKVKEKLFLINTDRLLKMNPGVVISDVQKTLSLGNDTEIDIHFIEIPVGSEVITSDPEEASVEPEQDVEPQEEIPAEEVGTEVEESEVPQNEEPANHGTVEIVENKSDFSSSLESKLESMSEAIAKLTESLSLISEEKREKSLEDRLREEIQQKLDQELKEKLEAIKAQEEETRKQKQELQKSLERIKAFEGFVPDQTTRKEYSSNNPNSQSKEQDCVSLMANLIFGGK